MKNSTTALLFSLLFATTAAAQDPLSIPTKNHCSFSGTEWEEELYRFDNNAKVGQWVNEILNSGGATKNFELIQASVENVAAVVDPKTGKRYLLYSQNFIEKAKTILEVYAALAHEIGHHANEHSLTDARRAAEELEADLFMGYVLAKTRDIADLSAAQRIVTVLPTAYPAVVKVGDRQEAIKTGWQRAEKSLKVNSAGFDNDPSREAFLKAQFEVRPCCSPIELAKSSFASARTLGDIARKLTTALDKQGYTYRSYMSFAGGFALVTQMEMHNADFSCRTDGNRWATAPVGETFKGYLDYFTRLLLPSKSYFRTFVFVVTTQIFNTQGANVSKKEAGEWYSRGFNRLPTSVANTEIADDMTVTALVYEFQVPESTNKPAQKCPTIDTQRHLDKSGLAAALR